MNILTNIMLPALISGIFTLILVPMLRLIAIKINLVDQPGHRKIHAKPIPLVGGISIAIAAALTLLVSYPFMQAGRELLMMLGAGLVLLVTGVLDDRLDIRAIYKLVIQLGCAYFITASGTRIVSLYGLFGVHEIPVMVQYLLTIVVITGVVNAFNLMDGVDGLAGTMALTGFIALAVLAWLQHHVELTVLYSVLSGALVSFLRFNLGQAKIFMGDGGSLLLGFLLVVSGLNLLQHHAPTNLVSTATILFIVIGIFLVPVLDSLRVYRGRIKNGDSPFTADKSHIHHLFLLLGFTHKKTVAAILVSSLVLLLTGVVLSHFLPITLTLSVLSVTFSLLTALLILNKNVHHWRGKLRDLETQ